MDQWFTDVDMDSFQRIWSQSHFEVRLSDRFSEGIVYFHNEMFDEVLEPASVLGNVPFSAVPPKIKIKTKGVVFDYVFVFIFLESNCT